MSPVWAQLTSDRLTRSMTNQHRDVTTPYCAIPLLVCSEGRTVTTDSSRCHHLSLQGKQWCHFLVGKVIGVLLNRQTLLLSFFFINNLRPCKTKHYSDSHWITDDLSFWYSLENTDDWDFFNLFIRLKKFDCKSIVFLCVKF